MALADTFRQLLEAGKELVDSPAVKQAISDDIAELEAKAQQGIAAVEAHFAAWLAARYPLPAPTGTVPAQPAAGDASTGTY